MDLEFVINSIKAISDDMCTNYFEPFYDSLDELTNFSTLEDQDGVLRDLFNNIQSSLDEIVDSANKATEERSRQLQKLKDKVDSAKKERDSLKRAYQGKEKQLQKLKKRCEVYDDKMKELNNLKDTIRAYKILTGTNFAFKSDETTGYTVSGSNVEVFKFDHSQLNQEDITKKLWAVVGKTVKPQ